MTKMICHWPLPHYFIVTSKTPTLMGLCRTELYYCWMST
jgi:hypothetical protein